MVKHRKLRRVIAGVLTVTMLFQGMGTLKVHAAGLPAPTAGTSVEETTGIQLDEPDTGKPDCTELAEESSGTGQVVSEPATEDEKAEEAAEEPGTKALPECGQESGAEAGAGTTEQLPVSESEIAGISLPEMEVSLPAADTGTTEESLPAEQYDYSGMHYESWRGTTIADVIEMTKHGLDLNEYFSGTVLEGLMLEDLESYAAEGYDLLQLAEMGASQLPRLDGTPASGGIMLMANRYGVTECITIGTVPNLLPGAGCTMWQIQLGGADAFCLDPGLHESVGAVYTQSTSYGAGSDVGKILKWYSSSAKSAAYYAAAQLAIWKTVGNGGTFPGFTADEKTQMNYWGGIGSGGLGVLGSCASALVNYMNDKDSTGISGTIYVPLDSSYQQLLVFGPPVPLKGKVTVNKTSSNITISSANPSAYSLDGAVYGIYSDSACSIQVTSVTISGGTATSGELEPGTYYVKEISAPSGYQLSTDVYTAVVESGLTTAVDASEAPLTGSFSMNKVGLDSSYFAGNSNYSLEGAVYQVEFSADGSSYSVAGTMTTDANGVAHVTANVYDSGNVAGASPSTADSHTTMTNLPIGSYRVTETIPSKGYQLDPTVHTFTVTTENYSAALSWTSSETPVIPVMGMQKVSATPSISNNNKCYSLEGAVYQVYTNFACTQKATALIVDGNGRVTGTGDAVLTTGKDGNSNTLHLPAGIYYVKEMTTSKGFRLDSTIHQIILTTVNAGAIQTFESKEPPLEDPAHIEIYKTDSEGITMFLEGADDPTIIGGATLAGAVFRVDYYDDYYDAASLKNVAPARTWYIETKYHAELGSGKYAAVLNAEHLAAGYDSAELYYNDGGEVTFPLGTVTMQELVPPAGYSPNNGDGGVMTDAAGVVETGISIMQVRPTTEINPDRAGTYVENPADNQFTQNADGTSVKVFTTLQSGRGLDVTNVITRGDFSFIKEDYETRLEMEDVYFRVTASSGESHIIRTGGKGYYSSDEVSHSTNTNAYDALFDAAGNWIGEGKEDIAAAESGLWFYGTADESEWDKGNIDDSRGALRYDESYIIEELPCPANEGKQLMPAKVLSITKDGKNIWDGNYTNVPNPRIHTMEWDAGTGGHISVARSGGMNRVVDTVSFEYLTVDTTYTLKGILLELKEDGTVTPLLDASGDYIRANRTFTTGSDFVKTEQGVSGEVDVAFNFDGSQMAGTDFIIYEYLFEGQDETLIPVLGDGSIDETGVMESHGEPVRHTDPEDEDQHGYFLDIHTQAWTTETDANVTELKDNMTIVDTVAYHRLTPGYEYKMVSELVYQDIRDGQIRPVLDQNGNPAAVTVYFVPDEADGTIDITFPVIDGTQLLDEDGVPVCKGMVAFEELWWNNQIMVEHRDIDDVSQTVWVPQIKTHAADSETGGHIGRADESVTITDTVAYRNLAPGREYTMNGILMNQATGEPLLDAEGREIHASRTFLPETPDGTVTLAFTLDASLLEGETTVVFETLEYHRIPVAAHADIEDEEQTVQFPKIHTTLTDTEGSKTVILGEDGEIVLVDTVRYENLIPGREYTMTGTLMNHETGKPVMEGGKAVAGSAAFLADEPDGTVEVTFRFNGLEAGLATEQGTFPDLVCFETLYFHTDEEEEVPVADHAELEDKGQTVELRQRGRVQVLKTGPFLTGTRRFPVVLPDGETQEVTRMEFEQQPFAGITFTVFDAETDEAVTSFTTGADGTAVSDYVMFGGGESYYIMETGTPAGLVQSTRKYPVDFTHYDAEDTAFYTDTIEIQNDATGARINVYKQGEFIIPNTTDGFGIARKGVEGVYFGVYTDEDLFNGRGDCIVPKDTLVGIAKTNQEGMASICESLVAGKYYFKELRTAGEEYQLEETRFDFAITYQRNTTTPVVEFNVNAEHPLLNRYKTRDVELLKTDEAGNPLSGVEFALYRKYGEAYIQIGTYVTAAGTGTIRIENVPYGDYYFIETKGLDGYAYDETTKYPFSISDDLPEGAVVKLTAVNQKLPDTPKTGDDTPLQWFLFLILLSAIGISLLVGQQLIKQKKRLEAADSYKDPKAVVGIAAAAAAAGSLARYTKKTSAGNGTTLSSFGMYSYWREHTPAYHDPKKGGRKNRAPGGSD